MGARTLVQKTEEAFGISSESHEAASSPHALPPTHTFALSNPESKRINRKTEAANLPKQDNYLNDTMITIATLALLLAAKTQGSIAYLTLLLISSGLPAHQGHH